VTQSNKTLERVRALLALATNPSATENESRNAAVAACKLIAAHRLELRAPETDFVHPGATVIDPDVRRVRREMEEMLADLRAREEARDRAEGRVCSVCGRRVAIGRSTHLACEQAQSSGRPTW
jgi:hypothetical protein